MPKSKYGRGNSSARTGRKKSVRVKTTSTGAVRTTTVKKGMGRKKK